MDETPEDLREACLLRLRMLTEALRKYHIDQAVYPPSGNASLVHSLLRPHRYVDLGPDLFNADGLVIDPWGRPFVYRNSGRALREGMVEAPVGSYRLYSLGPGGRERIELDPAPRSPRRPRG
jgi:hypothetical protein